MSTLRSKRKFKDQIDRETMIGMVFGLLNIEGLQTSIDEVALILDHGLHLSKAGYIDVLGMVETV